MIIIPVPYKKKEMESLSNSHDLFDLIMRFSPSNHYLIINHNTVAWLGEGTSPGEFSCRLATRSMAMNENDLSYDRLGKVGLFGKYSCVNDYIKKDLRESSLNALCVDNMKLSSYTGTELKSNSDHYALLMPIILMLTEANTTNLNEFLNNIGLGNCHALSHEGCWRSNKRLLVLGDKVYSVEEWFGEFLKFVLHEK